MTPTAKKKPTLAAALDQINKQFGPGTAQRVSENPDVEVEAISSGILSLDLALGIGGYPRGRMVEIFGPMSAGKTSIALEAVASAQREGFMCAFIDVEHALNPAYAQALGINLDDLILSQPSSGEEALEIIDLLVATGEVAVIIVDSVAAMSPRAEIDGDFGDSHVGLAARMMGQGMRKLAAPVYDNNVLVIWINQLRESIGKMYGPSEFTPGGRALPYYASIRLDVRRIKTEKQDGEAFANRTRVKVVKNKVGIPYKECEFDLEYGVGVAPGGILVDLALELGLWQQKGSWIVTKQGETIAQGRELTKRRLLDEPDFYEQVSQQVHAALEAAHDDAS